MQPLVELQYFTLGETMESFKNDKSGLKHKKKIDKEFLALIKIMQRLENTLQTENEKIFFNFFKANRNLVLTVYNTKNYISNDNRDKSLLN